MPCSKGRAVRSKFFLAIASGLVAVFLLASCGSGNQRQHVAEVTTGGNVYRGAAMIEYYGCGSCHTIPGISGAVGLAGPPLSGIAKPHLHRRRAAKYAHQHDALDRESQGRGRENRNAVSGRHSQRRRRHRRISVHVALATQSRKKWRRT